MQTRCPERFADNRAACLFASYLAGAEFWVLPDDFMVQLEPSRGSDLSSFEVLVSVQSVTINETCILTAYTTFPFFSRNSFYRQ
jgi:hypothetical protein